MARMPVAVSLPKAETHAANHGGKSSWQTVEVYAVKADGAYLCDAAHNQLSPVAGAVLRALTRTQAYVVQAPLNLVYVSDY